MFGPMRAKRLPRRRERKNQRSKNILALRIDKKWNKLHNVIGD